MQMTTSPGASAPDAVRPLSKWRTRLRKVGTTVLAGALLAGGFVLTESPKPAQALPRGEQMTFDGAGTISNFKMPDGKRAYCIEVAMGEPSGAHSAAGRLNTLPGRPGMFSAYTNKEGMRQMNYIIDKYGQSGHVGHAVATQLAVWAIRGDTQYYSEKVPNLQKSAKGREALQQAQVFINEAQVFAKAPVAPKKVTGSLKIEKDPNGKFGRFRVAYPKGVNKLTVKNGTWVRNGAATLEVTTSEASARYVDVKVPGKKLEVSATWVSKGTKGYEPFLDVYNTATASGKVGQRVAVATGASTVKDLKGTLAAETASAPRKEEPRASSLAQPDAEIGGTMQDTLIVTAVPNTTVDMWQNAQADFTAYLKPVVGATKVDANWDPVLGAAYDAQAEDPATGELRWTTWWANAEGVALLDESGAKIPTVDANGVATSGVAADGTAYPVQELGEDGEPVVDEAGKPVVLTGRDPVMETRQDPVTWTEEELSAMSAAQQCVAQPVYKEGGIAVPGLGEFKSTPTPVKSAGTIHWVERVTSNGNVVHQGKCGVANETTKVGQPAVITQALPEAKIGDEVYDVATVSGSLVAGVNYQLRFDAFTAPDETVAAAEGAETVAPVCDATNRVFRSDMVQVNGVGDYQSPSFTSRLEHGQKLWWVESLYIVPETGDAQLIHRGECGLDNETTRVALPEFETKAIESAVAGDHIVDTLIASGDFSSAAGAQWESTFTGYRPAFTEVENQAETVLPGEEMVRVPACTVDNQLFQTEAIAVPGPGEWQSPAVVAEAAWEGPVWWVETVTLIEGENRTVFHTGECGLENETTLISVPDTVTDSSGFVVVGETMQDTATITGPISQREGVSHEARFKAYRGDASLTGTEQSVCTTDNLLFETTPVAVPAEGEDVDGVLTRSVTSPEMRVLPEYGDTIWWVEELVQIEGETERVLSTGVCGLPNETTTVTTPTVRTESAGTRTVGEDMWDDAIVDGKFPKDGDAEFFLTWKAYEYAANGELTCTPETELKAFADQDGLPVSKAGTYRSKSVKTTEEHIGMGGYVETLTMRVDEKDYVLHEGKCGEASEKFEVTPKPVVPPTTPGLAITGGDGMLALLIGAGVLLGGGGIVYAISVYRKRKNVALEAATEEELATL
ncbi:hypothetical protein GCM10009805_14990 [Leucobacter chromiireducens subsp. solipictus]|uniref:Uncharacterized protein n=2 Tax=Leucobacter TaxID=55968 RepID=A0ABS1SDE6_9MICO|nr:hypothetical protein [Leucobacter chromiireducens subsp. solipictus]